MKETKNPDALHFPAGFLWGAAISAHQTEGNNIHSDWWAWENSHKRIRELESQGKDAGQYQSGRACDFYNLYDADFALAEKLGHKAVRISIEWARVEPFPGQFEEREIEHYVQVLKSAKSHGLATFVTLFHFTLPLWFADLGGFASSLNISRFVKFVERIAPRIEPYVDFWLTINEPEIYASHAYLWGIYPPHRTNFRETWQVVNSLISAHKQAAIALRKVSTKPVSLAFHLLDVVAVNILSNLNRLLFHYTANEYVLNRTKSTCDFIGVNYYNHVHLNWWGRRMQSRSRHEVSDLGWGIHPEGLERVLMGLKKYKKPIYITENGLADSADSRREQFIKNHLRYLHSAISRGVDVRGYLHWSLIDNFEWHHGFIPRFGLVEVDYKTQKRKPRQSASAYSEIIRSNTLNL